MDLQIHGLLLSKESILPDNNDFGLEISWKVSKT